MKTLFKLLFFFALLPAGFKSYSQCSASFNYTVGAGGNVSFNGTGFADTTYSDFTVDFGDGTSANGVGSLYFSHAYTTSGTYTVCVYDTNTFAGCTASSCDTLTVNLCQNASLFTYANIGFGLYSFNCPVLNSLSGATALWNFGDGNTSSMLTPQHQYSTSNTDQVCLTVNYPAGGCADTTCNSITVALCSWNPSFNIDTTGGVFAPDTLTCTALGVEGGYTYSWSFSDGGNGNGDIVQHTFQSSGAYNITLTVTDASLGCSASTNQGLTVYPCSGLGQFTVGSNGLNATFYGSVIDSFIFPLERASYAWYFPGGSPSSASGQSASIIYTQLGAQNACLYLTPCLQSGCIDTICQSFALSPPVYSLSGQVTASGSGACGAIYLIVQDTIGHLALLDSFVNTYIDTGIDTGSCGGAYQFSSLQVGTYYVKAALEPIDPNYANYLPTYFGEVLKWDSATPISLTTNYGTIDIQLTPGVNTGGPGFVAGYVSAGAGIIIGGTSGGGGNGNGSNSNRNPENPGQALSGVQINLLKATGEAVAYAYTNPDGHYQFISLAMGSYQIYAEELNKIPNPIFFTLTTGNPTDSTLNISINSHEASGIEQLNNIEINEAYPNPVSSKLELQLSSNQSSDATLKLIDVLGRTVFVERVKLVAGSNNEELNMEDLASGVYQLVLQTDSKQITYKIVKAR